MKAYLTLALLIFLPGAHADNWNVRVSPLAIIGGEANLRVDYRIGEQWMIGPQVSYISRSTNGIAERAVSYGLGLVYHFDRAFEDGAYLETGAKLARERARQDSTGESADFNNDSLRLLAGYHWFWRLLNLNLGAGVASNSAGKVRIRDAQGKEVDHFDVRPVRFVLDFSLGLSF